MKQCVHASWAMLILLAVARCAMAAGPLVEVRVSQLQMGMMVDLIAWAESQQEGQEACAEAFGRIAALSKMMSDYDPASELSQLNKSAGASPVQSSPELIEVLTAGRELSELSDGHFDITALPVVRLWRQARREKKLPDQAQLAQALALVGYEHLKISDKTASLTKPKMAIDLGGIAKGYIGEQAIAVLKNHGCPRAAFIAGGDMVFGDAPPDRVGWPVQPAHKSLKPMELHNCAFSVSGDTVQYLEVNGQRYSHVIDARTGMALTDRRMCIVIAPRGMISDALSTIGTILPLPVFEKLAHRYAPEAQVWVFPAD